MSRGILAIGFIAFLILAGVYFWTRREKGAPAMFEPKPQPPFDKLRASSTSDVPLPLPETEGEMSLEEAIQKRRSKREFLDRPLTLEQVSQILWAGYSIPSAGALYPLEVYLVVGEGGVEELGAGVYHYLPENHSLEKLLEGDVRQDLMRASLGQSFIADAPVDLVIAAEYERTTGKYGERGIRYVHMEVGHTAQNVYLQVTALGLGTVTIGAFDDEEVAQVLHLPSEHKPLCVMPIGHAK